MAELEQPPDTRSAETRTPGSIFVALMLFALAIAIPVIAAYSPEHSAPRDSWQILGTVIKVLLSSGAAALGGIIFTIVGARRAPWSTATGFAVLIASLFGVVFLMLLVRAAAA